MRTGVHVVAICGAAVSFSFGCCEENTVESARSVDGVLARVVSRECGGTVGYVTKVMLGSREILRMNANARTVSLQWEADGKTLLVSIPDDVASRDIFVKENTAGGRAIKYRRRSLDSNANTTAR